MIFAGNVLWSLFSYGVMRSLVKASSLESDRVLHKIPRNEKKKNFLVKLKNGEIEFHEKI